MSVLAARVLTISLKSVTSLLRAVPLERPCIDENCKNGRLIRAHVSDCVQLSSKVYDADLTGVEIDNYVCVCLSSLDVSHDEKLALANISLFFYTAKLCPIGSCFGVRQKIFAAVELWCGRTWQLSAAATCCTWDAPKKFHFCVSCRT